MDMNIEKYIKETDWKFSDLLQLEKTSREVAEKLYQSANASEMLEEIWEIKIELVGVTFGELYYSTVMDNLTHQVMQAFQKHFESATVKFEGVEPKIIEEPKPTPPPPPKPINRKLNTDGTDLPPGVERI
jgi:hypothetical protein